MTNHYHIQLKTNEANLDKAMKYFGQHYARFINKHTNASGPVFKSRYQTKIIENETYFLQVIKYIHLNPAEASLCRNYYEYKWSSISDYMTSNNQLIDTNYVLNKFISLEDFLHFHDNGNSDNLIHFYNRKNSPISINDYTVLQTTQSI